MIMVIIIPAHPSTPLVSDNEYSAMPYTKYCFGLIFRLNPSLSGGILDIIP